MSGDEVKKVNSFEVWISSSEACERDTRASKSRHSWSASWFCAFFTIDETWTQTCTLHSDQQDQHVIKILCLLKPWARVEFEYFEVSLTCWNWDTEFFSKLACSLKTYGKYQQLLICFVPNARVEPLDRLSWVQHGRGGAKWIRNKKCTLFLSCSATSLASSWVFFC